MADPNQLPSHPPEAQEGLLTGPRQTGIAPTGPNGSLQHHFVDTDGCKIVRQIGKPYKSVADLHAQRVAEDDMFEATAGVRPWHTPRAEAPKRFPRAHKAAQGVLKMLKR